MRAKDICITAARLVDRDRADQHGDMDVVHCNIAALWSAWLDHPISAHDVATMMELLKIARRKTGTANTEDYVDAAGYAGVAGQVRDDV